MKVFIYVRCSRHIGRALVIATFLDLRLEILAIVIVALVVVISVVVVLSRRRRKAAISSS